MDQPETPGPHRHRVQERRAARQRSPSFALQRSTEADT